MKKVTVFVALVWITLWSINAFALNRIELGPTYFPETTKSRALSNANIYVGIVDLDPSITANQKQVSVLQESGSIVTVSQPIRTNAGGVPIYNGSPVTLLVDGDYSLKVLDSRGLQIYYIPSTGASAALSGGVYCYPDYSEADQGATGTGDTVKSCIDGFDPNQGTIYLRHSSGISVTDYVFSTDETIPSNITLVIEPGARLDPDSTKTVTISGDLDAPLTQIITGDGDVVLSGKIEALPEWWGINTTPGTTDMTAELNSALSSGAHSVVLQAYSYLISASLVHPFGVIIKGNGRNSVIDMSTSGSFTADYGILYNSTDGSTAVETSSFTPVGGYKDLYIKTGSGQANKGIFFAGSIFASNLRFEYSDQAFVGLLEEGNTVDINNVYIDTIANASDWQIDLSGPGTVRIDSVFIENEAGPDPSDSIRLQDIANGSVTNSSGNNVDISNCDACSFKGWFSNGADPGTFLFGGSTISIEDSKFLRVENTLNYVIKADTSYKSHATFKNLTFIDNLDDPPTFSTATYDIRVSNLLTATIIDCKRLITTSDDSIVRQYAGILLVDQGNSAVDDFNDFSYMLSRYSQIRVGTTIQRSGYFPIYDGTSEATSDTSESNIVWTETSDTYYYRAKSLYNADRLVGAGGVASERSIALTVDGDGAKIGTDVESGFVRLYRGTSTGSYSDYVDIPVIQMTFIYDTGERANGFPWISRTPAAVDTMFAISGIRITEDNVDVDAISTAPTVGTWTQGDRIENRLPTTGDYIGIVCTTGGTPGTWKDYGAIL